jgi:PAS domain S-box-containing protein
MMPSDPTPPQPRMPHPEPSVSPEEINPAEWVVRLVADSPIASVVCDPRLPDNPIVVANKAFVALTGYAEKEILGRNCRFLAGPDTEPWLSEAIREGVRGHKPVLVEILNYKKDGTPFRNAVLVAPIYDEEDELLYFVGSQVELGPEAATPSSNRRAEAARKIMLLSPRQREVTELVAGGLRNKQIAHELGLSEKTVKMHRGLVMEKLGLRSSAELVRVAVEAGL